MTKSASVQKLSF